MERDALTRLARQQAIALSAEAEVELIAKNGSRPLLAVLIAAKREAQDAMVSLVHADPNNSEEIRRLQGLAHRYADMVRLTHNVIASGVEADRAIAEEDASDIQDLVGLGERDMEFLRAHGLTPPGVDQ